MKVEAIKHEDVLGHEIYYVKITGKNSVHLMKSGKSTFDKLKKMEADETETSVQRPDTEGHTQTQVRGQGNGGNTSKR